MFDLKQRRIQLGLTMLEVAKLVGVSEATISRYESGNIKNMRRDRIEKYAKALQVSPSEFLNIDDFHSTKITHVSQLDNAVTKAYDPTTSPNYVKKTITEQAGSVLKVLPLMLEDTQKELDAAIHFENNETNAEAKSSDNLILPCTISFSEDGKLVIDDKSNLLNLYDLLNDNGKKEAVKRIKELTQLPNYKK